MATVRLQLANSPTSMKCGLKIHILVSCHLQTYHHQNQILLDSVQLHGLCVSCSTGVETNPVSHPSTEPKIFSAVLKLEPGQAYNSDRNHFTLLKYLYARVSFFAITQGRHIKHISVL